MQYFVTGATGFIGKRLVKTLLRGAARRCTSCCGRESEDKVPALLGYWGVTKPRHPVLGDLTARSSACAPTTSRS